jgi:aspartate ammonia-lyase
MAFRTERDTLGELNVPAEAYFGIQTARAVDNFSVSGLRAPADLVTASVLIKKAAAEANRDLHRLDADVARAIIAAADELLAGAHRDQFVVDVYQAGAGTSHNMNVNEVLANRAAELLGERRGSYERVHPNDHVNMGQSTNDVYPASTRLALLFTSKRLRLSAIALAESFDRKAVEFRHVLKTGRTHLQDAVPMTLGQELGGYAACVRRGAADIGAAEEQLMELNIGATAVGTGLNAGDEYRVKVIEYLRQYTTLPVRSADNLFRVTQSMGDVLACSGAMRRLAVELGKISSDLRLLSMGPRAGLGEITLPAVQPGSSIMPGKINPSIPEMVNQVCFQVIGCDVTIAAACEAGQLELNVMMPVIAWNALHASTILANAMTALRTRTVDGLTANEARARELLDRSTAAATALSPYIGYAATAEIAEAAIATGRSIRDLVLERQLLDRAQVDAILSVDAMIRGGVVPSSETPVKNQARNGRHPQKDRS